MLNINYDIISLETIEDALKAKRYFDKVFLKNAKKVTFELNYRESYWNDLFGTSNNTYNYNYSKLNYGNCIAFSFNSKIIILKSDPLFYKFTINYETREFTCNDNVLVFDNINTNIIPVDSIQFKLRSTEDNDEMEFDDDNYPLKISYNDNTNKISKGFERYLNDFAEAFTDDFNGFKFYSDSVDYTRTINFNNFSKELFSVSEYYPSLSDDYADDDDYGYYENDDYYGYYNDYDYEYSLLILCGDVYLSLFEIKMDDLELDLENSNDEVYKLKTPIMLKIETPEDLIYRNYIVENIYKSNINEETNTVIIEILSKFNNLLGEDYGFYY